MKLGLNASVIVRTSWVALLLALGACNGAGENSGENRSPIGAISGNRDAATPSDDSVASEPDDPGSATGSSATEESATEGSATEGSATEGSATEGSATEQGGSSDEAGDDSEVSSGTDSDNVAAAGDAAVTGEPPEKADSGSSSSQPTDETAAGDGGATTPDAATVDPTVCSEGKQFFYPGCGADPNPLQAGCYQECSGEDDTRCASGERCAAADINPCVCNDAAEGSGCCAACGQGTWLCQPEPASGCAEPEAARLSAAADTFGFCAGECRFELTLQAGGACDQAVLNISDNSATSSRSNSGVLSAEAQQLLSELGVELSNASLEEVYGCPDCADGGASSITLSRAGKASTHSYEYNDPPDVFVQADALLRELKTALRQCESNDWISVDADCSSEPDDTNLR